MEQKVPDSDNTLPQMRYKKVKRYEKEISTEIVNLT